MILTDIFFIQLKNDGKKEKIIRSSHRWVVEVVDY